ncbi:hypothetical protein BUALT_Bualt12G0131700 [Buddleja alternifolia]|uniref:Photosystem I reaction center subunit II, chloroplastic n=1 Tax=Buddleja alternifolia TaxID=168488 RepID=A0AAV6WX82_9LAMI|nr:hypothetical protein BUALT_Bualt12G0131700 [Buddleja alternifolia]
MRCPQIQFLNMAMTTQAASLFTPHSPATARRRHEALNRTIPHLQANEGRHRLAPPHHLHGLQNPTGSNKRTRSSGGIHPTGIRPHHPIPDLRRQHRRSPQVEEFYVITWESPKEQVFEMPIAGAAITRQGPNLLKLARKEQCLALGTRLRSNYKIKYQFYRVSPNGEVQYSHPKGGVYPEKVNPSRVGVGQNMRSIGKNVSPIKVKFTGKQTYEL